MRFEGEWDGPSFPVSCERCPVLFDGFDGCCPKCGWPSYTEEEWKEINKLAGG